MAVPKKESIPAGVIRFQGLFDWGGLYYHIADWFKRYRYFLFEEMYKHKVPSPFGAEQELYWYGDKEVNEWVRFRIHLDFHLWDMTEVEVIKDGKKKLLTNARIEIKIRGDLIFDWQHKFEKSKFTRMLRDLYLGYVWRRETSSVYGDMIYYRMLNLHAYIKKYLDLQTKYHAFKGYLGEER
ncbi:MAG TPA: hypothetical protein VJH88_03420 [Candidatus Nanoarchaeia archaeon]|nr:hypothetical protein [Candidatus Nanoarchaeia archaeon]